MKTKIILALLALAFTASAQPFIPYPQSKSISGAEVIVLKTNSPGNMSYSRVPFDSFTGSVSPETFGAIGDGVTDDTAALQAAINKAELSGQTVFLFSKTYALSSSLVITSAVSIYGRGVNVLATNFIAGNYDSYAVPTLQPYLTGSVLLMTQSNMDVLQISTVAKAVNLQDFGIKFAYSIAFTNTGNAIYAMPPVWGTTNRDNGIQYSHWRNLYVWGVDGNHWSYFHCNGLYNRFDLLGSTGGGGFCFEENGATSTYYPGNFTLSESSFFSICRGTNPAVQIRHTGNGLPMHISFLRVQGLVYNVVSYAGVCNYPPLTAFAAANYPSPIKLCDQLAFSSFITCAWENAGGYGGPSIFPQVGSMAVFYGPGSVYGVTNFAGQVAGSGISSTPYVFTGPVSWGKKYSGHQQLRLYDWADTDSGGPYLAGMEYDSGKGRTVAYKTAQAVNGNYGWGWDVLSKDGNSYTNKALLDEGGNFKLAGGMLSVRTNPVVIADLGSAKGGMLWCSNGVWFATVSTDGATVSTVKFGP